MNNVFFIHLVLILMVYDHFESYDVKIHNEDRLKKNKFLDCATMKKKIYYMEVDL